jgi:hypothetical protein
MAMGKYFTPTQFDGIPENQNDYKSSMLWHAYKILKAWKTQKQLQFDF